MWLKACVEISDYFAPSFLPLIAFIESTLGVFPAGYLPSWVMVMWTVYRKVWTIACGRVDEQEGLIIHGDTTKKKQGMADEQAKMSYQTQDRLSATKRDLWAARLRCISLLSRDTPLQRLQKPFSCTTPLTTPQLTRHQHGPFTFKSTSSSLKNESDLRLKFYLLSFLIETQSERYEH